MIVVVTGVAGAGKTTIGKLLARDLGWKFYDADDLHPAANVEKMRRGEPLDDADRRPSHADRRKALQRHIMEHELSTLASIGRLPRKILQLTHRLMDLAC